MTESSSRSADPGVSPTDAAPASERRAPDRSQVFALLKLQPGQAEGQSLHVEGLAPQQIAHAFRIAYASLAVFVAVGAWIASRVPVVRLTHWEDSLPASAEAPAARER
ncbi:MAG TPA: hypothetical protein VJ743_12310 [Albitalea sp.]|nr:hypothetical protein [Albitalea sp.]